jgi:hypothetical protein
MLKAGLFENKTKIKKEDYLYLASTVHGNRFRLKKNPKANKKPERSGEESDKSATNLS